MCSGLPGRLITILNFAVSAVVYGALWACATAPTLRRKVFRKVFATFLAFFRTLK